MEIRKVFYNGTSTLISIPKQIALRMKLTPATYCKIEETAAGAILITPVQGNNETIKLTKKKAKS